MYKLIYNMTQVLQHNLELPKGIDQVSLDIESDLNENVRSVCEICQVEDSVSIYKNTCANCHLKSYKFSITKLEEIELYNVVNELQPTVIDRDRLRSLMKLKRELGERLVRNDRFNPMIESKFFY